MFTIKHKKYEARTFKYDFGWHNDKCVIGDDKGFFEAFVQKVEQIKEFENPDMFLELETFVLAIEHFCFDSGKLNKNGSLFKQNDAFKQKRGDTLARRRDKDIEVFEYSEYVDGEMSYFHYCKSLIAGFNKHYEKLSQYEAHLRTIFPSKPIKFAFLIEDTTPMGNMIVNTEKKKYPLFPLICPEFIKLLYGRSNVTCLICKAAYGYLSTYYLLENTIGNLNLCMEDAFDSTKEDFIEHGYRHTARYYSLSDDDE